ncbi:hypothetical protein EV646_103335 [Kribbella antiqua]|uniref:Uncharacterized protein n=1 Tax=Kribbella antiqua TaxID=2512217 RepID=A0A4R2IVX6_9ACTN|nr:hypothetical protein [Kribbella antiqua]TCO49357.1 hypothetical protein EV646_103335 [Kribbella antiqua]
MAAFVAVGIAGGAEAGSIVTASAFVYLGSAALQRRTAAWPVFAVSFVAVGLGSNVDGINATWVMLAIALALVVYGVIRGAARPGAARPLQTAAMVALASVALIAADVSKTLAGLLVAADSSSTPAGTSTTTAPSASSYSQWPSSASYSTPSSPQPVSTSRSPDTYCSRTKRRE